MYEFYENAEIFITGGSGVVGKALLETILRMFNVRRIYVLLRPKKNMTVEERLKKICNHKIYDRLRKEKPGEVGKMIAVPGDATYPNLGITPEYAKMMENVSVVFHSAATVRFDERLADAILMNVGGTFEALKFAETLKNLRMFVHISTFFSNPYVDEVEAKVYPSPMSWELCLDLAKANKDSELLDSLTKKIITGFPNTYTFTKNLAESLVNEFRTRIPVCILKPSIVMFSFTDPNPGFPSSLLGAMGLFALVSAGVLKTVYLGNGILLDFSPQDVFVKLVLFFAMHAREKYDENPYLEEAPVYPMTSYEYNDITFENYGKMMDTENIWYTAAFEKALMIPGCIYTSSWIYYKFLVFTKQIIPALIADGLLRLFGQKPVVMGLVRKAYVMLMVMQPFMFNNYKGSMLYVDEYLERYRGTKFDMEAEFTSFLLRKKRLELCKLMVSGVRQFALYEDPKTIKRSQRIHNVKVVLYNTVRLFLAYKLGLWLYNQALEYVQYE